MLEKESAVMLPTRTTKLNFTEVKVFCFFLVAVSGKVLNSLKMLGHMLPYFLVFTSP